MKIRQLFEDNVNPYKPMTTEWASYLMAHDIVPDGYFVHGRNDGNIRGKPILQVTKRWDVAEQYANTKDGIPYIIKPNNNAINVNFDNEKVLENVAKEYVKDYLNDASNIHPGEIDLDENDDFEYNVEIIKHALTPDDIVSSAQFYDTREIEWLSDYFNNEPLVIHWKNQKSGVIIDPDLEGIDFVKADRDIADEINGI